MIVTERSRAKITFGLEKIDDQLDRLAAVMEHVESSNREIQTVNLMVQRNTPVTFFSNTLETSEASGAVQQSGSAVGKGNNARTASSLKKSQSASNSKGTTKSKDHSSGSSPRKSSSSPKTTHSSSPSSSAHLMDNPPVRRAIPVNSSPVSSRQDG
jgi:hypothetical protein